MQKKRNLLLFSLAFVLLLAGAVFLYQQLAEQAPEPELLAPVEEAQNLAPNFSFFNWDGEEIQLSDFFGTPIVLNFWATWCPSCVVEMPYFETLYQEMGEEIQIIKVNLLDGQRETRARVEAFLEENGYTFPSYFDTTGAASRAYGVSFIPVTFFIDAYGVLQASITGPADSSSLAQGVDLILQ